VDQLLLQVSEVIQSKADSGYYKGLQQSVSLTVIGNNHLKQRLHWLKARKM
jgi:hypothetical protein